jgi:hypothetical protein
MKISKIGLNSVYSYNLLDMRLCRLFCRIKSITREDKIVACALIIWMLILVFIIGLVVSFKVHSSKHRKSTRLTKNNNLDKTGKT